MEYTTLVLGAGVSQAYGYPSGLKLVDDIVKFLEQEDKDDPLVKKLKAIRPYSIDQFIADHGEHKSFLMHTIARIILKYENEKLLLNCPDSDDFYRMIFNSVAPDKYKTLKIITYNYDRSFEWSLNHFVKHRYKESSQEDIRRRVKEIDIIHIHGRLPKFDFEEGGSSDFLYGQYGNYAKNYQPTDFFRGPEVAKSLGRLRNWTDDQFNVVYDETGVNKKAREILQYSHRIFFVGFSYNSLNIEKLGHDFSKQTIDQTIGGTTMGLPGNQFRELKRLYPAIEHVHPCSAVEFFTQYFDLKNFENDSVQANGARRHFTRPPVKAF